MTSVIDQRPTREPLRHSGSVGRRDHAARVRPMRADEPVAQTRHRSAHRNARWQPEAVGLLVVVALLTLIGLAFVLSASSVVSLSSTGNPWTLFVKQAGWVAVGLVAGLCSYAVGIRTVRRARWWIVGATVCALALVRLTPLGQNINGSTRWIGPASFRIQPSELAKLAIVVGLAYVLTTGRNFDDWRVAAPPLLLISMPLIGLVLAQPDLGTSFIIAAAGLSVLWAAGLNSRWLGGVVVGGGLIGTISVHMNEYQWARLVAFMHQESPEAYHIRRSLAGIGAGGMSGVGVGASRSKWGFLPNAHTDFIYSVIAEEVGLVGAVIVLLLFAVFAMLGVRIAHRASDPFSRLVAFGITGWISVQAIANVAAVTGVAPVTGVPMPFVSQGGTAFVSLMIAVGIMVDVARRGVDPLRSDRRAAYQTRHHPSQHAPDRRPSRR
jgi:cell division protein FtsW